MYSLSKLIDKNVLQVSKHIRPSQFRLQSTENEKVEEEFRVLNLNAVKNQRVQRKKFIKEPTLPPRSQSMPVDQDWGAVWPGPRTFHPATVPLPVRQGYPRRAAAPPGKFVNAELMKIPNFLHLTPPVIQRQCEALKQFCTPWPKGVETDEKMEHHFPIEVITSDYCHSAPTIRNPLSRIVTIRLKLARLNLDKHAKDKFQRLVNERYNQETDTFTLVTDRCPLRKQNYDYAMYLLTALIHESKIVEPWEATKSEADMEEYIWTRNSSKVTAEAVANWGNDAKSATVAAGFGKSVENLINEGENDYNLTAYKEEVLKLLGLPPSPATSS